MVVSLNNAGGVDFDNVIVLGVNIACNIAFVFVLAICLDTVGFTVDSAHLSTAMIATSETKVDDTSLTAGDDAAGAPSPSLTTFTADDGAPSAAAAYRSHHHADAFVSHQGRSRSRLHHGAGCRLGLWCDSQGHRGTADVDAVCHHRLCNDNSSLADKRALQDMWDPGSPDRGRQDRDSLRGWGTVSLGLVLRARGRSLNNGVEHLPPGLLNLLGRPADALFESLGRKPDLDLLLRELCDDGQVAKLSLCRVRELTERGLQEGRGVHGGTVGRDAA